MDNYVRYIARLINEGIDEDDNEDLSDFSDINSYGNNEIEPECIVKDNLKFVYDYPYVDATGELVCQWVYPNQAWHLTDQQIIDYLWDDLDKHLKMGFRCEWNMDRQDDRVIITPGEIEFCQDRYDDEYASRYYHE